MWFDNTHPALRRCWHPVCRAADVPDGAVVGVTLLGQRWAVARLDGVLTAVVDECPHRLAPLSAGRVVDGVLQCAYHGYRFDGDGRCVLVPALGPGAPVARRSDVAVAHGVCERYGLVWLAPEEPVAGILDVPEWDDPAFTIVPMPDLAWSAGAAQMTDNFLDLAHFPFTHTGSFGDPDDAEVPPYDVERDGWGFVCDHFHSAKVLADSLGSGAGRVEERRSTWWFQAPFSIRLRIHYVAEDVTLVILFFHQPVDAQTTHLYCFDLRDDIADGRTTPDETREFQLLVSREDQALLERFTTKAIPLDLQREVHTRADRITLELRRILRDLVDVADRERASVAVRPPGADG